MLKRIINKLREKIWNFNHEKLCRDYRKKITSKDFSIFSMNCTGGILYHDLGMQFMSPTINLFFRAEDFIKFCENLEYYLSIDEFIPCQDPNIIEDRTYPIAYLGDLLLFLVHYNTVYEAQEKWNERKKRINWNHIIILNTDREGTSEYLKDRFEKLPYKKIIFVNHPDTIHSSSIYIKGYENEKSVGIITEHIGWLGLRPIDQFDWVGFLNGDV